MVDYVKMPRPMGKNTPPIGDNPTPIKALETLVRDIRELISLSEGVSGFFGTDEKWDELLSGGLRGWLGNTLKASERVIQNARWRANGEALDPNSHALDAEHLYKPLAGVLQLALNQAQSGKGRERHADDKPFIDQPILDIARMLGGMDGHAFQIAKKAQEAARMTRRGHLGAARAELLGVIVYAAAAHILLDERAKAAVADTLATKEA